MLNIPLKLPLILLLGTLLGAGLPALADEELSGRLFTTAAERARLDQLRLKKLLHPAEMTGVEPNEDTKADLTEEATIDQATLDGYVTRSSGKTTAWVNQNPHDESQGSTVAPGLRVVQRPGHAAQISMQTRDGKRVSVKVGETLDRISGKVEKIYDVPATPPELPARLP